MKLLTLLQTDTLQVVTDADSDLAIGFLVILGLIFLFIFSIIRKIKKNHKKKLKLLEEQREQERVALLTEILKDKELPYFKVKGITEYEPKKPGCYICQLKAEPENPYDRLAVKIEHPKLGMIGHISKGNGYIHELAKTKTLYGATLLGFHGGKPYGKFFIDPSVFTVEDISHMEDLFMKD